MSSRPPRPAARRSGYVQATYQDGEWRLAGGQPVRSGQVVTDLYDGDRIRGAIARVLSVYGISDVVMEAFGQFEEELFEGAPESQPPESP